MAFDIGGTSDVKTIKPSSALPAIMGPLTIDGYTQPGASVNTAPVGTNAVLKIVLDGSIVSAQGHAVRGLEVMAAEATIRGLVINNGFSDAIRLAGSLPPGASRKVSGNFIGTDPSGTIASPNAGAILIEGGPGNVIGGAVPSARNLLSGNRLRGVMLISPAHHNSLQGNLIGTQRDGSSALANHIGIHVLGARSNLIGGSGAAANTIAFNKTLGVSVERLDDGGSGTGAGTGNRILGNSIFANGLLGIDLAGAFGGDGLTANDPLDLDTGPNQLQNFPVIKSAERFANTQVAWSLHSRPARKFTVQFFINPNSDRAEGRRFIGQQVVTTDASGDASAVFVHSERFLFSQWVTATATDGSGNTSEFSAPREVLPGGGIE